jgi:hypothetical protein
LGVAKKLFAWVEITTVLIPEPGKYQISISYDIKENTFITLNFSDTNSIDPKT